MLCYDEIHANSKIHSNIRLEQERFLLEWCLAKDDNGPLTEVLRSDSKMVGTIVEKREKDGVLGAAPEKFRSHAHLENGRKCY